MSLSKRITLIVLFAGLLSMSTATFASPARQDSSAQVVTDTQTGLTTFIGIDTNSAGLARASSGTPSADTALADIGLYAADFGLQNPAQELQFMKASSNSGSLSFRYQQIYQGVPIVAGELIVNYDATGQLAALTGEISPLLNLSVTPSINAASAATLAVDAVANAENVAASELTASTPTLWIYDPHLVSPDVFIPRLVWRTEVTPSQNLLPIRYLVLVDAQLNGVALAFNQIDSHGAPEGIALRSGSQPSSSIVASRPASVQPAPNFPNPSVRTYTANLQPNLPGTLICNTIPTSLTGAGSCQGGSSGASVANAAHYFAYQTFNYYDSKHNRNSINNSGMSLISTVNYREDPGEEFPNAFWNGTQMVYGDADFYAADDVVGHELTHGVTDFESNLFYWYESGAINESMSDIFGEIFDQSNVYDSFGNPDQASDKWLMGEDLSEPIRDMEDPPAYDQPDSTQSIYYTSDPFVDDNGGVHTNSGVSNKAAYLMAQGGTFNGYTITALGNDKTASIFYMVNSTLLSSGSGYKALGAAMVQACNNIRAGSNPLGITASDCDETYETVLATEMHLDSVYDSGFAPQADLCAAGMVPANYLFNDNLENGLGNFTDGTLINTSSMPASYAWQEGSTVGLGQYATSGTKSLFGVNHPALYGYTDGTFVYESFLRMNNNVSLPPASNYYLHFNHSVWLGFSNGLGRYDGAVVEYSTNNGSTWSDIQSLFDAGKDYDGEIFGPYGNPLNGRDGFLARSHGYVSSRYNLATLAGQNVRFRWLIGTGSGYGIYGWFLDDIKVYQCVIPAPEIAVERPGGTDLPDGGTLNIGSTAFGQPINQTLTVRNVGQLDLTLLTDPPTTTGDFSVSSFGATTIPAGGSTTFTLSCNASSAGAPVNGTVSFDTDDVSESTFNFSVTCDVSESAQTASPVRNYFETAYPTLTWNPLAWVDIYDLQIADNTNFTGAVTYSSNVDNYTLPDSLANGRYYWRVRGKVGTITGAWSSTESFYVAAP